MGEQASAAVRRVRAEGIERARSAAHALLHTDLTDSQVTEHALVLAEEFVALDGWVPALREVK